MIRSIRFASNLNANGLQGAVQPDPHSSRIAGLVESSLDRALPEFFV